MTRFCMSPLVSLSRLARRFVPALCALTLAACATNLGSNPSTTAAIADAGATPSAERKPVRIAMLLPLSGFGPTAVLAKGLKQAGELALFELDNPLVQLTVKDDLGTPQGAAAAADEAIREGAEIIVGPLTANATTNVAPVARQANVPVLTFSNDRRVAGNGVYLMSFLPEQEIERIVAFSAAQGKRQFAALIPNDAYGKVVEPAFRAAVARSGGVVAALDLYSLDANAMLAPAKQMVETIKQREDSGLPIDALLLAGGPEVLPHMGPLITYSGINTTRVKLLGTGAWEYPNVGRNAALVGGWYPGPDPHGWQDFSGRFSRSFGSAPPRLASLAYDAVGFAVALSANPPGQRFTPANLTRPTGYNGVDGMLRFLPDGTTERALAVLEVQSFANNVVDPAPSSLDAAAKFSAVPGQRAN
jgi:ABC-type branched-subunit amino acid transport system substrate-binding protein